MFKPKRESRFGGNKFKRDDRGGSFGGRREFRRDGDMGSSMAHEAVCADCGKACKVPFKPNGKKPVYCINCFKKEGNAPEKTPFRGSAESGSGARVLEAQLKAINEKLDAIMEALND
jgi:CxxC-x17-CxxC domain-containing protein